MKKVAIALLIVCAAIFAQNSFLQSQLQETASKLSLISQNKSSPKGEFETTEQYNKRLEEEERKFNDSSEARFLKAITSTAISIRAKVKDLPIIFEKYDADEGIYTVLSDITGIKHTGQIKVSPKEAKELKEADDLDISVNPSDVYVVNHDLYIAKMEISHGNKKYIAEFPKLDNMQEIVFRGSELWKENPVVKDIEP
jgi:hypothetical protein